MRSRRTQSASACGARTLLPRIVCGVCRARPSIRRVVRGRSVDEGVLRLLKQPDRSSDMGRLAFRAAVPAHVCRLLIMIFILTCCTARRAYRSFFLPLRGARPACSLRRPAAVPHAGDRDSDVRPPRPARRSRCSSRTSCGAATCASPASAAGQRRWLFSACVPSNLPASSRRPDFCMSTIFWKSTEYRSNSA